MIVGSSTRQSKDTEFFTRLECIQPFILDSIYFHGTFNQWILTNDLLLNQILQFSSVLQAKLSEIRLKEVDATDLLFDAFVRNTEHPNSLRTLLLSPPFASVLLCYESHIDQLELWCQQYNEFKISILIRDLEAMSLKLSPEENIDVPALAPPMLSHFSSLGSSSSSASAHAISTTDYEYISTLFTKSQGSYIKLTNKESLIEKLETSGQFFRVLIDLAFKNDTELMGLILGRESVMSLKRAHEDLVKYQGKIRITKPSDALIIDDVLSLMSDIQKTRPTRFDFNANFEKISANAMDLIASRARSHTLRQSPS